MNEPVAKPTVVDIPHNERLVLPEEAKLPLPRPGNMAEVPPELRNAWMQHMINGFQQNQQMFKSTLAAFMKPYRLTVIFYAAMFVVGIGLFLAAVVIGFTKGDRVIAVSFAGLSITAFLTFFIRQPLRALEENLECITWLGVAFNTYWSRLMYATDANRIQEDLEAADDAFRSSVKQLIKTHDELRKNRPA
jgi:ABC-type multidrug transport system fused ATPase/permease subunit